MTREKFLTVGWNNILAAGLGLPALLYVIAVLSSPLLSASASLIGLSVIGVVY